MPDSTPPSAAQLHLRTPPHRNHGLFSDHYLDGLLERADWRLYSQSAAPAEALARIRDIFSRYTPSPNEAQTEDGLIKPILHALGHTFEVQAALDTPGGIGKPDYFFYQDQAALNANKGKLLTEELLAGRAFAVGDAKYWDRPLDVSLKGHDRRATQHPGAQIEFYLRHSGVPWGILTNGRLWRLYHTDSARRLDRYYEIDLPALLDHPDPQRFIYFYGFFSRRAFQSDELGVEAVRQESIAYARAIGDSLKGQAFDALRHLTQGFLDVPANGLRAEAGDLKAIYDASLIVLYRLLFILYAEARDLLPLRSSDQYRLSYSLASIANEIRAGKPLLRRSGMLWARLAELFEFIDEGSQELTVPVYNGGLFDPARHPFLASHVIGDYHLQQAIDKLARVDRQFVDYRDLAVRHLGTIYEGLLEYHPQPIAPADGWTVDLRTEKGERKATGSYYTPDYIVTSMVEQTLAPLLQHAVAGATGDEARVDAVLAVKVLDMAMGSGHFLVEATEYIARFLVDLGGHAPHADGLDELAYWKRRVIQTSIYGVDLNPLAVDLARLSLWLITVARDHPLSFLDHHLRAGNALIGARLTALAGPPMPGPRADAQAATPTQLALFDEERFRQKMTTAVDAMWLIERHASDTAAEVRDQERLYTALRAQLTGAHGAVADALTAQHFGLAIDAKSLDLLASYVRGQSLAAPQELHDWLEQVQSVASARRFFHWELEFPEVFFDHQGQPLGETAGFDAILGNPPYIRQEGLSADKPYLAAAFPHVYHGMADLSVYFFAQALLLLRPGGRTSFINSNSWLRANYATPLRAYLRGTVTVERLIDLGDNRVFADAPDVYPAIHLFARAAPPSTHVAQAAVFVRGEGMRDFAGTLEAKLFPVSIHDQPDSGWQMSGAATRALLAKLMAGGRPLGEVVGGRMYRGILTGLNEAFIVDQAIRDRLIAADPHCAPLIKPILRGEDLRPWYQEDEGRWLIGLPSGWTVGVFGSGLSETEAWRQLQERHPAIADHLHPFADAARKRQDKGQYWWELRPCDYYGAFEQPKIMWPDIAKRPRFSWDTQGYYLGNTGYMARTEQRWLLGFLGSRCAWFLIAHTAIALGERAGANRYRLFDQSLRPLPVPVISEADQAALGELATLLGAVAQERYQLHTKSRHRIQTDLGGAGKALNQKLLAWWELDFPALRAEVQKVWKRDIPLRERADWEVWLAARRAEHTRLTREIVAAEAELNERVYALYQLSAAEIRLLEDETTYRYGEE